MNIFVLDTDPKAAAKMHCDIHCSKMILESAQMLSTAAHIASGKLRVFEKPNGKKGHCASGALSCIYRPDIRHLHHKCTEWVYESRDNFDWTVELATALHAEKLYRTGRGHASIDIVRKCIQYRKGLPSSGLTPFALAMPDELQSRSATRSYRRYYIEGKAHLLEYTRREPPAWLAKHFEWERF